MARKTKEDADLTRQAILDAAEQVFLEHGVTNASMAAIADRAQISRGAVYGHYKNKMEVALAMCTRGFREMATWEIAAHGEVSDVLLSAAMDYLQRGLNQGRLERVLDILYLKCEQTKEHEPLLRWRGVFEKLVLHTIRRIVKKGWERGEVPQSLHLESAIWFLYTVLDGVYVGQIWGHAETEINWDKVRMLLKTGISTLHYSPALRLAG